MKNTDRERDIIPVTPEMVRAAIRVAEQHGLVHESVWADEIAFKKMIEAALAVVLERS